MDTRKTVILIALLLGFTTARAQWTVFDPSNLTQSIINSTNEIVETSTTAENMIKNFQQTLKIYNEHKAYYDRLKKVNNLVRNARKVQRCMLLVGEISDVYVNGYERMLRDRNFTPSELAAIARGYTGLLERSANALRELKDIVNPSDLSMTDKDRLDVVDRVNTELTGLRSLASYYTRKNISVSLLRSRRAQDRERVVALYGSDIQKYW